MRTQEEILKRIEESKKRNAFFNFEIEVLVEALDFEHAKPFLKNTATPETWNVEREADGYGPKLRYPLTREEDLKKAAAAYLKFAWGKAEDHRGISAGRSVDKMTSFCWLLGHDTKSIEEAGYANYGCPKLKACAELLGEPLPTDEAIVRMMQGEACHPYCEEGCDS